MPRGSRPSTAALMRLGARKASEMVIWTCRLLQPSRDSSLDLGRGNTGDRAGAFRPSFDQSRGDGVAMSPCALAAVARAHAIAAVIEDATHQQSVRRCASLTVRIAL